MHLRPLPLLGALSLLWLASPASAGRHQIVGQVVDRNGEPVERAVISLAPGNVELVTDREGRFLVDYLRDEEGERVKLQKKTDYQLEVFKPGFHVYTTSFFFKKKELVVPTVTLVEETIDLSELPENLDPGLDAEPTHAAGANYEGQ